MGKRSKGYRRPGLAVTPADLSSTARRGAGYNSARHAVGAALRLQGDRCELCGARPVKLQPVQCVDCGGINAFCAECAEMVAL